MSSTDIGNAAENLAAHYLQKQGLKPIASHFHSKFGEIDLIMQDGDTLVFVEVRLRKNKQFGGAEASITSSKQHKIVMTAEYYLQQHGNKPCRFDVVLMDKVDLNHMTWIKNAFEA
jgi:putative endonuclease